MNKHLEAILKKQFEIAGHLDKFDTVDFKNTNWFSDFTWTTENETDFKHWVIKYLSDNRDARKELMTYSNKSPKFLNRWFMGWNLMYGFKISE